MAQLHQYPLLIHGEAPALAGALQLDQLPAVVHYAVQVNHSMAVLLIAEIQQGHVLHNPGGDGGHLVFDWIFFDHAGLRQFAAGNGQRGESAGDRGGTGTAVALENVAVDGDGPLTQRGQVHRRPEAAANEPLNLRRAGTELQFADVPAGAFPVGAGQHGVLRRHPAGTLRYMAGGPVLHAGAAEHHGFATLNEDAALSEIYKSRRHFNRTQFAFFSAVNAIHLRSAPPHTPWRRMAAYHRCLLPGPPASRAPAIPERWQ